MDDRGAAGHGDASPAVDVGVLGPLTLSVGGRGVPVTGDRRRALLALLATAGRHGLGTGRLVDALWGESPPREPLAALHNLVSRLRRHLGASAHLLERRPAGYRLIVTVDADVVRDLLAAAAGESDPHARLQLTARASRLWRGEPLGEFAGIADLAAERAALAELRRRLDDAHLDALVDSCDPTAVTEAVAAVAATPIRENATRLLVRALAAEGRTVEAMAAAAAFRARLRETAGLDPSPALAALEQSVAAGWESPAGTGPDDADSEGAGPKDSRPVGHPRPAPAGGPLVGRERDRAELVRLLAAHRLVTLTGTGGVGKTTLALDIVSDPSVLPGEAVFVVDLTAVTRQDRVAAAVASTLGLDVDGPVSPAAVAGALPADPILLVLDNCEHVLSSCRELTGEVVRCAPNVRILATSRVVLASPAEYVVRLQPLQIPHRAATIAEVDTILRQNGIRAFVEHARRRNPDFAVTERDLPALVDILWRVDGLPLGIQLAARQAAVMPLPDVARMLDRALDLATDSGVDGRRGQTFRVSVDMSFRLLSASDQAVLTALAPFPGGVTLRTFQSLAVGTDDPVETLHRLVDSSLVVADAAAGRYRLLHLIRHYLLDHLERADRLAAAEDRFIEECVTTAREIEASWLGADEPQANRRLHAEMDNLRSARDLAIGCRRIDVLVAITTSLSLVGTWRNIRELWTWAIDLARSPLLDGHDGQARVLSVAAEAARLVGEFDLAVDLARQAIRCGEGPGAPGAPGADTVPLVGAHAALAAVAHFRGDFDVAISEWTYCGRQESIGPAYLASAALAASYAGDRGGAARLLGDARSAIDTTAGPSQHAFLDYVQAELVAAGDPTTALALYERAHDRAAEAGATFIVGVARVGAASCLTRVGDTRRAAEAYVVLLEAWRDSGQPTQLWTTARNAAALLRLQGRRELAESLLDCAELDPAAAVDGTQSVDDAVDGEGPHSDAEVVLEGALRALREVASGR
ncbi:ATP-binding protein [Gordonia sp. NPDC058843]|uniref:ATP-binding protein n=1 Tax=Gordonia sp. NPDC058843 TaxID=3346648 RepID=UPI003681C9B2